MRRRSMHLAFAAAALGCTAAALHAGWQLRRTEALNAAVAAAAEARAPADARLADHPRVRLARATAQSAAGEHDEAAKLFNRIVQGRDQDALARAAAFNLGNMHLRQGMGEAGDAVRSLPMIELAKQRYRELLRARPDDWDARYNLERALWLAPEQARPPEDAEREAVERRQVMLRGMQPRALP